MWQGTISFGLVTVPVAMYGATEDHAVRFRQLQRGTADRVRNQRVNERTGDEVPYPDVVKGYQVDQDEYVVVEPDELADIAPDKSRSIEIETFVELSEIDPIYFDRTYWLAPADTDHAHAYYLLHKAMSSTDRVGIARFVMRNKEYLTAVRAGRRVLTLQTMHFADELRDPVRLIPDLPKADRPRRKELDMAVALIESMSGAWQPTEYADTYQERVRELVRAKQDGEPTAKPAGPAEPTNVLDLGEALRRSVRGRSPARSATSAKSAAKPKLSEMSKSELDGLARELGIKGRSRMTRAELAKAVGRARRRPGARRTKVS
jgi:DNA end-binding protein Ku